jgi:hypothetical protein
MHAQVIGWFWDLVSKMKNEERLQLLQFVTGVGLCVSLCVCLWVWVSICLCPSVSVCLSVSLSVSLSLWAPAPPVCHQFMCLCVRLGV